jgi:LytS/YehU family sensor histidine kinase
METAEVCLHTITQILFFYPVIYYLVPVFFYSKKYVSFFAGLLLLTVAVIFIYYVEHIFLFKRIHQLAGLKFMTPALVYWFTVISFISHCPLSTGLGIAIKIFKDWHSKQMENQLLIIENASAELQLLKAQIHPHFLFNTLNNIYSFTLDKSPKSAVLVNKLSATLRYMIEDCEAVLVPLRKEIDIIIDYIQLQKIRYGNRLQVDVEVTGSLDNKLVTPLLLIPFIENSFKHGTSQMLLHPWIKMYISVDEDSLLFKLSNSKPPTTDYRNKKSGIGLSNVKKRLELLYPFHHKLHTTCSVEMYNVQMHIPIKVIMKEGVDPLSDVAPKALKPFA